MSSKNTNNGSTTYSISFSSILTLIFIVLKLCKIINWSWIWVLAPTWIPIILVILIFIAIIIKK